MSWAINNLTAPDNYSKASTLDNLPAVRRLTIDVVNAGIYWQLKEIKTAGAGGAERMATWGAEVFLAPSSKPVNRRGIVGVRFRAATPLASLPAGGPGQAQVTVEAF